MGAFGRGRRTRATRTRTGYQSAVRPSRRLVVHSSRPPRERRHQISRYVSMGIHFSSQLLQKQGGVPRNALSVTPPESLLLTTTSRSRIFTASLETETSRTRDVSTSNVSNDASQPRAAAEVAEGGTDGRLCRVRRRTRGTRAGTVTIVYPWRLSHRSHRPPVETIDRPTSARTRRVRPRARGRPPRCRWPRRERFRLPRRGDSPVGSVRRRSSSRRRNTRVPRRSVSP